MEKGQGNGTDTLKKDNDFVRRGDVKCLLENTVCLHEELSAQIDIISAADVVPVVRCRDCKHRDPEDRKCDCGGLEHAHMFPVSDDWFCADGEKREIEHD